MVVYSTVQYGVLIATTYRHHSPISGEAFRVRDEADGVPFGVHVEQPDHREPRLADERGDPAPRARGRRAARRHQRGRTAGEEGQEQGKDGEVGQLPRRAGERDPLLQLELRLIGARHGRQRASRPDDGFFLVPSQHSSTREPQENTDGTSWYWYVIVYIYIDDTLADKVLVSSFAWHIMVDSPIYNIFNLSFFSSIGAVIGRHI